MINWKTVKLKSSLNSKLAITLNFELETLNCLYP